MKEFLRRYPFESEIERERALSILSRVEVRVGTACPRCGALIVGQEVVESVVLGFQDEPCCHRCLAEEHGEEPAAFLERMRGYVDRVPCFRATWEWCGDHEGEIRIEGGTG